MLVDLSNGQLFQLPLLKNSSTPDCRENTGIHSMQVSHDNQYLAAGGVNPHELAIYKLPELTPYALGQVNCMYMYVDCWAVIVNFCILQDHMFMPPHVTCGSVHTYTCNCSLCCFYNI